jgi:hypothetical protein
MPRHFLKEALLQPEAAPRAVHLAFSSPPYFNPEFVEEVINELSAKEFLVKAGLEEFTAVDKLAFRLLYESGVAKGMLPEVPEKRIP